MLSIFFSAVLLLPVWAGWGRLSEYVFGRLNAGISGQLILGIMSLCFLSTLAAFFIPLNIFYELFILLTGLSAFFYFGLYKGVGSFFESHYRIFVPALIFILFAGSFFPFILDHFGYYVPTVQWLTNFGLVKGISNLDLLLGQMSLWHIFQAGFSGFSDPFLRINVLLLVVYLIYILEKKSWLHLLFLPLLFFFSQSPSPDLPVIVFSLIVLNEILTENRNTVLLFALSAVVFAIKPTAVWLPLFVFLYGIFKCRAFGWSFWAGAFIIVLFFLKNIWVFGYPVFPLSVPDFSVSWSPNPDLLHISAQTAIEKTFDMQYSYAEIQHFSVWQHIKNWFFLSGVKSIIHLVFVVSLFLFTVFTVRKNERIIWFLWASIVLKSVAVLMFSAQYRFFIEVFFVVFFVVFYRKAKLWLAFSVFVVGGVMAFAILSFPQIIQKNLPSFKLGKFMMGFQKGQLLEPSFFAWKKYSTHTIGNLTFHVVKGYPFSFDVPIPAISPEFLKEDLEAGIFPQKISQDLKDGFQWRNLNEQERHQLRKIVEDLYGEAKK